MERQPRRPRSVRGLESQGRDSCACLCFLLQGFICESSAPFLEEKVRLSSVAPLLVCCSPSRRDLKAASASRRSSPSSISSQQHPPSFLNQNYCTQAALSTKVASKHHAASHTPSRPRTPFFGEYCTQPGLHESKLTFCSHSIMSESYSFMSDLAGADDWMNFCQLDQNW